MSTSGRGANARPGVRRTGGRPVRGGSPRRPAWRRWLLPGALTAVTALVLVLYFTPLLSVRDVRVQSGGSVVEREVVEAAAIEPGTPMLRVDESAVRERLAGVPAVAGVDVVLSWPSEVVLRVDERTPRAFLPAGGGARLVDGAGVVFDRADRPPEGLPRLSVPGGRQREPSVRAATAVLAALPDEVRAQVAGVRAQNPGDVLLRLQDGRKVHWGDDAEMRRKAAILPALLTRPGDVYDVTTPALPTVA